MKIRKSERGEVALNDYMIAIVIFMIGAVTVSYLYINNTNYSDYVERIHLRIRYESLNKNIRDYYINKIKVKEI